MSLSGCVETQQYADVQFTPPQGDYKLLVLRPDVTVGSLTTGGMVEPRADWTDQARASIVARASQRSRRRTAATSRSSSTATSFRASTPQELADVERLNCAVDQSIVVHKYLGDYLPTKRGKGLDWTLGAGRGAARAEDRLRLCLFLHAEDQVASTRPDRARACSGLPAASSAFARPTSAAHSSSIMPRSSTSRPARWCGSTSSIAGSQVPGIKFGDLRTPQGAAQMVDRLLGRMKPGQAVRQAQSAAERRRPLMCMRCLEISRRSLLVGGGAPRPSLHTGVAQARVRPQDMVPLVGPGFRPTDKDETGPVAGDGAGRGGDRRLQPPHPGSRSSPAICKT